MVLVVVFVAAVKSWYNSVARPDRTLLVENEQMIPLLSSRADEHHMKKQREEAEKCVDD